MQTQHDPSDIPSEAPARPDSALTLLTASQAKALTALHHLYQLNGYEFNTCVSPRLKPLITGGSGYGKTAIITAFSQRHDLPLLCLPMGAWSVFNARSNNFTVLTLRKFVRDNRYGCLYMDELDKVTPHGSQAYSSDWALSVFVEVLSVLDCDDRLLSFGWTPEDIHQFRSFFFTIGSGAWQHLLDENISDSPHTHQERIVSYGGIPPEILRRFNGKLIAIEPPTRTDFFNFITKLRREMELSPLAEKEMDLLTQQAVGSRLGMRWLEGYVVGLLLRYPEHRQGRKVLPKAQAEKKEVISHADYALRLEKVFSLLREAFLETSLLEKSLSLFTEGFLKHHEGLHELVHGEGLQPGLILGLKDLKPLYRYATATREERYKLEELFVDEFPKVVAGIKQLLDRHCAFLDQTDLLERVIRVDFLLQEISSYFAYLGRVEVQYANS